MRRLASLLLGFLLSLGACSTSSTAANPEPTGGVALLGADCDPLVPSHCGFPMPSNVYLVDDSRTVTGKRVAFGRTTLPGYTADTHTDPNGFRESVGRPS